MQEFEVETGPFLITCDKDKVDVRAVHAFLSTSYWSPEIPIATVQKAVDSSLCFSVLHKEKEQTDAKQIGFARVISDQATFAYLCDVYILAQYRGQGLAKSLVDAVLAHPQLQGLRRFLLATRDAHGLYKKSGFVELAKPESFLEIYRPAIYQTLGEDDSH